MQKKCTSFKNIYFGISHSKDAFYGREFYFGPLGYKNSQYMDNLGFMGIFSSEMESSILYTLSQVYNSYLYQDNINISKKNLIKSISICLVLSLHGVVDDQAIKITGLEEFYKNLFTYCFETLYQMYLSDLN